MLFTNDELYDVERYLQRWVKNWYVGGIHQINEYKRYDDKVWLQIAKVIRCAEMSMFDSSINNFLLHCKYDGLIYRVMEHADNDEGVLYPMKHYQSWTKDINSLQYLAHKIDNPVIIEAYAHVNDYAIDVSTVLNKVNHLSGYKKDNEVTVPIHRDNILGIYTAKLNPIEKLQDIHKDVWFMDSWYDV